MLNVPSIRAQVLTRRTYNRPLDDEGTIFETWEQTVDRVIDHQRWLWSRSLGDSLIQSQNEELDELRSLFLNRLASPAGRTLWLGGTEVVKRREASNFNCSGLEVRSVHDLVDIFWLLLQGCGVGFKPVIGTLSGFTRKIEVEILRSSRKDKGGEQHNKETYDPTTKVWTIRLGDTAEAWAKSVGKILAGKFPAKKLLLDFSEVRPAGTRLKGYGWICCGDEMLAAAYKEICVIMNRQAGKLLSKQDIWRIINLLGTVLSNRRSAQIGVIDYGDKEWYSIATMKPPGFDSGPDWYLSQSNNSLFFYEKPTKRQLKDIFEMMIAHGGGEPGFVNMEAALRRAPWCKILNPCAEVLLADKGFCNLTEIDLAKYRGDHIGLHRATHLVARANYRQTCVNLRDGILQDSWHQNNEFLRLCGVGLTGICRRPDFTPYDYRQLRYTAIAGAYGMADELRCERPKNVTLVKPSGTLSKAIFDTTEGAHKPKARHIFNNVQFSKLDPSVEQLKEAGYKVQIHPNDKGAVLVTLPFCYDDVQLDHKNGVDLDLEPAVTQLNRYKMLQHNWTDQNTSITVSYDPSEQKSIIDWFDKNWDDYVAVSFLFRNDVTKTAADLGFAYLPQEVVTKEKYEKYVANLKPLDLSGASAREAPLEDDCPTGACPVR